MFTNPHTHPGRRVAAALTAVALAGGFALAGATSAQAADTPDVAVSSAQFLSGSLLGTNLGNVVALKSAAAHADSDDTTMTQKDPLQVTALNAITVGNGQSIQANLGQLVQLGAIGQYATASKDGSSMAWTGAVSPDGAVGLGKDVATPGGNATVDLSKLLGSSFAANLANLQLAISAVSAKALSDGSRASGDYSLAGVDLKLTSPAISALTEKVTAALDSVTGRLARLDGSNGILAADLNKTLTALNPALNLLGAGAHVTATIDTGDLHRLVQDLLTAQYGGKGISFNLETGVVTLNLEELLGKNLNSLAPGTELINAAVLNPVLNSVTTKVSGIADQVVNRVRAALNNATVTVHADLSENVAQSPVVHQVCNTVKKVVQVPTQVLTRVPVVNGVPLVGGLLGSLVGDLDSTVTYVTQYVTQYVDKTVDQVVCTNQSTARPALNTSVTADITGTVNEFLSGTSVRAVATAKVLGVTVPNVDLKLAVSDIASALKDQLLDSDSAVTDLVNALNNGLVNPAVKGLTGSTSSVGSVLTKLVSVTANNREVSDGTFTETALRVSVLPGLGADLTGARGTSVAAASGAVARLDIARASVGPNVTSSNGGGGNGGGGNGGNGGGGNGGGTTTTTDGGGITGTASSISRLAITGAGIAGLVAAVLALLAAGAYLVRESYRKNRRLTKV